MPFVYKQLFRSCFALLTFLLFNHSVFGQCPVPNSCTPGNAPASAYPFGMGIYNVAITSSLGSFSNPTSGVALAGYEDFSCTKKATVLEGVAIPITVATNPNANENVRVWLDLNNNGAFDNTTELVFSSMNAKNHVGTFTIPINASVVKNTVLRMRVAADNFASPLPTPCFTPQYSQVEDYGITVVPNTNKPAVDFTVNNPVTCSPTVQFHNLTQNGATSWLWDFGDGNTATSANPSHSYAATGTYTVKLTACNANGCDSLTKTNYVTYQASTITAASCTPATLNYCCGYGITNVNFGNGLMTNASADGSVGYEDFMCSKIFTVSAGKTYPIALTTGNLLQDTKIYIDLNNDGDFTDSNEKVLELFSQVNPVVNLTIPFTNLLDTPLRMRIISDIQASNFNSCSGILSGQAEDYTIKIIESPFPDFTFDKPIICDGTYSFTDLSTRNPASWNWNFGDTASGAANVSTFQHPTHTFSHPGSYIVTLVTCNSQGCDSIKTTVDVIKNQFVNFPSACIPQVINLLSKFEIIKVELADINNNTSDSSDIYFNYACNNFTELIYGNTYQVSVQTHSTSPTSMQIWIDMNNDGEFHSWERVFYSSPKSTYQHFGQLTFPINYNPIRNTYIRMRVRSSGLFPGSPPLPCELASVGETEDYAVMFIDSTSAPTGIPESNFTNQISLFPNPNNGTFSLETPTVMQGDFQLEVHNMIGQQVAAKTLKQTGENHQLDLQTLPKGVYLVRVFNAEFSTVKKLIIE